MATAAEKRHMDRVQDLGCLIDGGPAEIHHVKLVPGQARIHWLVLPLCPAHHRPSAPGGDHGVALEAGKETWESRFGTQREHLVHVYERLGYAPPKEYREVLEWNR